jgi:hypothetical protein
MATSEGVLMTEEDRVEAALLQGEMLRVERQPDRTVFIKNNIYAKTNFYIKQSRPYFSAPLTTYFNFWFHQWYFLSYFIAGLFTPLDPIFSLVWFCIGVPFFFLYLQHMYVNIKTMPYVLRQPSLPDGKLDRQNAFFKISYASFTAVYGETSEASVVRMDVEGGMIKVQVFQRSAMWCMKKCVIVSTLGFCGSICMMDYCLAWFIVFIGTAYNDDYSD